MPHLVMYYTDNLDADSDIRDLCRKMADTMLAVKDEEGKQVFPTGGVRVLAYPAHHYAVADGQRDYAFIYMNLRMGRGRSEATKQRAGDMLAECAKAHFAPVFEQRLLGLTLQIDEGPEVFDSKTSNIHSLFKTL
jgi:5-carboxymethyl-2-hydroxymuconate isomerase